VKTPRALLFALVCGLIAAVSLYLYISGRERYWSDHYGAVAVLVAAQDIPRYTVIDPTMLAAKSVPKDFADPDHVKVEEREAVIGNMAMVTIPKGSQITKTKVSLPGEDRISSVLETDKRACTISVDEVTGVAGLIRPGDHVDVLGAFRLVDEKTKVAQNAEVVTLFQNIPVMAVGRNYVFEGNPPPGREKSLMATGGGAGFSNVTVSMTPRQCMDLTVAQQVGVITLTLRSYRDRMGGKTFPELRDQHSTTSSATGIRGPMEIGRKPKWLEIRGEHSTLVP
jgi:pilus assembly protein CpaB